LANIYDNDGFELKVGRNWSRRNYRRASSGVSPKSMEGKPTEAAGDQYTWLNKDIRNGRWQYFLKPIIFTVQCTFRV
jgi:hypothetical protein